MNSEVMMYRKAMLWVYKSYAFTILVCVFLCAIAVLGAFEFILICFGMLVYGFLEAFFRLKFRLNFNIDRGNDRSVIFLIVLLLFLRFFLILHIIAS